MPALQAPYSAFGAVYAEVMADIPYPEWFRFAARYLPESPLPLADLFSGPGCMATAAREAGHRCISLDSHLPFLAKEPEGLCADAEYLPFSPAAFSGLLATNAAMNYLSADGQLARHLAECYRVLEYGGVYVFDVCPHERAMLLATRSFEALNSRVIFRHSYASDQRMLTTTVTIAGQPVREEQHRQKIFLPDELESAAKDAGFVVKVVTANYGLPVTGENFPIMTYVLRKP